MIEEWTNKLKKYMPGRFRFEALPMFFCYGEPERIRSVLLDKKAKFIQSGGPKSVWALNGKIFTYPNEILSIRIILVRFSELSDFEILEEDEGEELGEDEEEDEEGRKSVGNLEDLEDLQVKKEIEL
eukprot:TRINITY_DN6082_c0_g1_i6.p1 TRINITY_DN6082_c0_g1~~TRINITY_DN6082_c0_g1_i6.p1  ORF type:complete len:127 (-),score=41.96 TRINITY_DN6082_c0_g1_i6:32-412(-)